MKHLHTNVMRDILKVVFLLASFIYPCFTQAINCVDVFREVEKKVAQEKPYNQDFGSGVFLTKVSVTEFRIEPPLVVIASARQAQKELQKRAQENRDDNFTVLFHNISEKEVFAFKAMLELGAKVESDARLTAVLLPVETDNGVAVKGYEDVRMRTVKIRDMMLQRYNWKTAEVNRENVQEKSNSEAYRLTVRKNSKAEEFLLRINLKKVKFIRDRSNELRKILAGPDLRNATPETLTHVAIQALIKSDGNILNGTLKVMAADFSIAQSVVEQPL